MVSELARLPDGRTVVGVCGESCSGTPGLSSSSGEMEALESGPSSAPPSSRGSVTHSLTRQRLAKGPPVRVPGTAQSGKTEVGNQCLTSQSVPDVGLRPRMWESAGKTAQGLGSPGGPVVKMSPSDAGRADSIPLGGAGAPHALWPKNQEVKQQRYCNRFNKDFKNGPHQKKKKKNLKKIKLSKYWVNWDKLVGDRPLARAQINKYVKFRQ